MTVEGFRATQSAQSTPGATDDHEANLWWLATFLSACSSWNIIDSWTGTVYNAPDHSIDGRYKGDPIADAQPAWVSPIAFGNGWGFVVEMANPVGGRPPLQVCFQWSRSNFAPVSGDSYNWDATNLDGWFYRMGIGDWDDSTTPPDFNDTARATDTQLSGWHHYGSGNDNRLYLVVDDGYMIPSLQNNLSKVWNSVMWIGRYTAKTAGQDTVANPAYLMVTENNAQRLDPDGYLGSQIFLTETPYNSSRVLALDELGVMRDWPYSISPGIGYLLTWQSTAPNEFDSAVGIDLHEVLIRGRGTFGGHDDRLIGSLPGIYAASRLGPGAQFDGGNFMCLGTGFGVVTTWDGTTV